MKEHHPILAEIDRFLASTGMSETYFGKRAVNNSELVGRLREGQGLHFRTEARVRDFIKSSVSKRCAPSAEAAE